MTSEVSQMLSTNQRRPVAPRVARRSRSRDSVRDGCALCAVLLLAASLVVSTEARATEELPGQLADVDIVEHRGDEIDLDLEFSDHQGHTRALRDFFDGDKPVLLTLNYYECHSICSTQLAQLTASLDAVDLAGDEFRVVTVSIDPEERASQASHARSQLVETMDRDDIDWTFLVGEQAAISQLADEVGFLYRYDEESDQFAHVVALFFLSPSGTIVQYLYGISYVPRDVKFALIEASEGTVGSPLDRIILSCFHYVDGNYSVFAFGVMRIGGLLTVVFLGAFLAVLWRRERRKERGEVVA